MCVHLYIHVYILLLCSYYIQVLWNHIIDTILHNSFYLIMYFGDLSSLHRWAIIYVATLLLIHIYRFSTVFQWTIFYMYYFTFVWSWVYVAINVIIGLKGMCIFNVDRYNKLLFLEVVPNSSITSNPCGYFLIYVLSDTLTNRVYYQHFQSLL